MNLNLTWAAVEKAAKGKLQAGNPDAEFNSFTADSRKISAGGIFWALKGKNYDGHNFLEESARKGAAGWITERGLWEKPAVKPANILEVSDTLKALQLLAACHRRKMNIPVTAITGSNGKSTTKEMLKYICSQAGSACSNPGNLNNQFGVPFSILELAPEHRYGIFELGASHEGDILEIGTPAWPNIAVLTNISAAHLEFFKDIETIYRTKTELLQCLAPGGTLVYNADDPLLRRLKTRWKGNNFTFGFSETADIRICGQNLRFLNKETIRDVFPKNLQRHNLLNAAAAAAAAAAMEIGWDKIAAGLKAFRPLPMRMQVEKLGDAAVILDAYNANPESMKASISALLESGYQKPLVVILGDMKELGGYSQRYHQELGGWLALLPLDGIFLAGPEMKAAADEAVKAGAAGKVRYCETPQGWINEVNDKIKEGGTFLIKASRAMKFEEIFKNLGG